MKTGSVTVSDTGTGQGSVISPLLANVYLHYVIDLWAERWRRREATGDMIIVRYADDLVVGFEHEADARRFLDAMRERLEEFALSLHPDKTRIIEFGRHAAANRERRGLGKPETFNFLGFTFICGKTRQGKFLSSKGKPGATACGRSSRRSRRSCAGECTSPSPNRGNGWGKWSEASSTTTRCRPIAGPRGVPPPCHRTLAARPQRRGQRDKTTWSGSRNSPMTSCPDPASSTLARTAFAVKHPRWEPYAGKPHVRFCAGGAQ